MITGHVTADYEATLRLDVQGPNGKHVQLQALIDTGFNGSLSLATGFVADLALPAQGIRRAELADGSFVFLDTYQATVVWDGEPRRVQVVAAEGTPLLGMAMLKGQSLAMDVVDKGLVTIRALPAVPK